MTELSQLPGRRQQVECKIVPSDSDFIIGSNTINSTEDLYAEVLQTVVSPLNRRNKRLFDIVTALMLILLAPLLFWFQRRKKLYFAHCWKVLIGQKSWVGTRGKETRPGIFGPEHALSAHPKHLSAELKQRLQLRYLRNYKLSTDLQILTKNIFNI